MTPVGSEKESKIEEKSIKIAKATEYVGLAARFMVTTTGINVYAASDILGLQLRQTFPSFTDDDISQILFGFNLYELSSTIKVNFVKKHILSKQNLLDVSHYKNLEGMYTNVPTNLTANSFVFGHLVTDFFILIDYTKWSLILFSKSESSGIWTTEYCYKIPLTYIEFNEIKTMGDLINCPILPEFYVSTDPFLKSKYLNLIKKHTQNLDSDATAHKKAKDKITLAKKKINSLNESMEFHSDKMAAQIKKSTAAKDQSAPIKPSSLKKNKALPFTVKAFINTLENAIEVYNISDPPSNLNSACLSKIKSDRQDPPKIDKSLECILVNDEMKSVPKIDYSNALLSFCTVCYLFNVRDARSLENFRCASCGQESHLCHLKITVEESENELYSTLYKVQYLHIRPYINKASIQTSIIGQLVLVLFPAGLPIIHSATYYLSETEVEDFICNEHNIEIEFEDEGASPILISFIV